MKAKKLQEGWTEVELGNVDYFTILASGINEFEGEKKYLSTESVQGTKIEKIECIITYKDRPSRANMQPILNSVWFAKMQATLKIYSFNEENKREINKYILSTGFAGIKVNENLVSPKYLRLILTSQDFNELKDKLCTGSTQRGINNQSIEKISLVIPPLPIQQKIVSILEKAEQAKEMRKGADELTKDFLKAVFMEMFGDHKNAKKWKISKLEEQITFMTSGSRGWAEYYTDQGSIFIRIQNVKNSKLILDDVQYVDAPKTKESLRTKVNEGDLLISITADLGRTAVVDKKTAEHGAYINQHIALLRLKNSLNPLYCSFFLESEMGKKQFEKFDQEGVKSGLSFNSVKSIQVFLPPLSLQNKFASIVKEVEAMKEQQKHSKEHLDKLFNALMQKAFKGELTI